MSARRPRRRPDAFSAGGVVARRAGRGGWEVALIRVGSVWGLPKGTPEPGESPVDTALREISEEIGVPEQAMTVIGRLPAVEYFFRDGPRLVLKRVDHFLVQASAVTQLCPDPAEVDEAAWIPLRDATRRATHRDLAPVLAAAECLLEAPTGPPSGSERSVDHSAPA